MGMIGRLPSAPSRFFDPNRVDASDYAYKRLQTPDESLHPTPLLKRDPK